MFGRVLVIIGLVCTLGLSASWALAQGDPQLLTYGQTRNGSMTEGGQVDAYAFEGTAGDMAVITMRSLNPDSQLNFNPFVSLFGPNGNEIASDDDSAGAFDARIIVRLPVDGQYTFEARVSDRGVDPTGNYVVGIDKLDATMLAYGDIVSGQIQQDEQEVYYLFEGQAGDAIAVEMRAAEPYVAYAANNFDPALRLLGPGGILLDSDNDSGALADAVIMFVLPEDGLYTILATANHAPSAYTLLLGPAPLLEPGQVVVAPALTWRTQSTYGVRAEPGDTINLVIHTIDPVAANFKSEVLIRNNHGTLVAEAFGQGMAKLNVTLPEPSFASSSGYDAGIYLVQVGNDNEDSTGSVAIMLESVQ